MMGSRWQTCQADNFNLTALAEEIDLAAASLSNDVGNRKSFIFK